MVLDKSLDYILHATRAQRNGQASWKGHCPAHEDRSPSLSIGLSRDGRILLYCFAGCSTESILAALGMEWRDLFPDTPSRAFEVEVRKSSPPPPKPNEKTRERLLDLWREALPLEGTPALSYLSYRGLDPKRVLPVEDLRFHPHLEYREGGEVVGHFPALLARVVHPAHGLVALHRTYLHPEGKGKAPVTSPKKLTPSVYPGATQGGAIRLFPSGKVLCVTEGIETALALRQATGLPVWATVSAGGMEAFLPPKEAKRVIIGADHDPRGLEAAFRLARRLSQDGKIVQVLVPPLKGRDWLDLLVEAPAWTLRLLKR